ncbi:CrcB-like protein [Alkalidesulfovibrio alkalitolerans DSM 16529]|uniref:Fluoride-specific ion channel FluC n=1 Tax=Alkalidesulfovibrio alkalitolerans DSM 16529 TaxID=1121439 RepID=S7UH22_9BACT|nr:CrcB-like protein [Alkalidesulfovibrio alkalitolerans DSM 16529]
MIRLQKLALIALAGSLGALSRYGLASLVHRLAGTGFPLGTFVVNVTGCLAFGLCVGLFEGRVSISPETRFAVLTGFLGSYTTFSTYAFESAALMRDGQWLTASVNIGGQIVLGLVAVVIGLNIARAL